MEETSHTKTVACLLLETPAENLWKIISHVTYADDLGSLRCSRALDTQIKAMVEEKKLLQFQLLFRNQEALQDYNGFCFKEDTEACSEGERLHFYQRIRFPNAKILFDLRNPDAVILFDLRNPDAVFGSAQRETPRETFMTFLKLNSHIQFLDLSGCFFTPVPNLFIHINQENMTDVKIVSVPQDPFNLRNLTELDVSWSGHNTVPDWLVKLTHLKTLKVSGNPVRAWPESFFLPTTLKVIEANFLLGLLSPLEGVTLYQTKHLTEEVENKVLDLLILFAGCWRNTLQSYVSTYLALKPQQQDIIIANVKKIPQNFRHLVDPELFSHPMWQAFDNPEALLLHLSLSKRLKELLPMVASLFTNVDQEVFQYIPGHLILHIHKENVREVLIRTMPCLTDEIKQEGWQNIMEILDEKNEKVMKGRTKIR